MFEMLYVIIKTFLTSRFAVDVVPNIYTCPSVNDYYSLQYQGFILSAVSIPSFTEHLCGNFLTKCWHPFHTHVEHLEPIEFRLLRLFHRNGPHLILHSQNDGMRSQAHSGNIHPARSDLIFPMD